MNRLIKTSPYLNASRRVLDLYGNMVPVQMDQPGVEVAWGAESREPPGPAAPGPAAPRLTSPVLGS